MIQVFYHIACMGKWQPLVIEQLTLLKEVGLTQFPLNIGLLGDEKDQKSLKEVTHQLDINYSLGFKDQKLQLYEEPTLSLLYEAAKESDGPFLYFHTKGVSDLNDESKKKWRWLMQKYVIKNWAECVGDLKEHDVVGVNWRTILRDGFSMSHFSGNFWWARGEWIRKLLAPSKFAEKVSNLSNLPARNSFEFWISNGQSQPNSKSYAVRDVNFGGFNFDVLL